MDIIPEVTNAVKKPLLSAILYEADFAVYD